MLFVIIVSPFGIESMQGNLSPYAFIFTTKRCFARPSVFLQRY